MLDRRKKYSQVITALHIYCMQRCEKFWERMLHKKEVLVNDEYLRFDFSHFAKVTDEEIAKVEAMVNEKIREIFPLLLKQMTKEEAMKRGPWLCLGKNMEILFGW